MIIKKTGKVIIEENKVTIEGWEVSFNDEATESLKAKSGTERLQEFAILWAKRKLKEK